MEVSGDEQTSKISETQRKKAVIKQILSKHDAVTNNRRYNAILATASINDAIEYYNLFKEAQIFREMDRVMVEYGVVSPELPRYAVEKWIEKRPNEKRKNQKYRLNFTKRFVSYLQSKGYRAYYPNYYFWKTI